MNYSIMAHGVTKYGFGALRVGAFMGSCFLSYGFGLMRGEKRMQAEIDRSLGIVKAGIELVIDEKRWKELMKKEMEKQAANKNSFNEIDNNCAHPH
jgi:hypothetical protein